MESSKSLSSAHRGRGLERGAYPVTSEYLSGFRMRQSPEATVVPAPPCFGNSHSQLRTPSSSLLRQIA